MKIKIKVITFVILVLSLIVTGCGSGQKENSQDTDAITLKVTTLVSTTHPFAKHTLQPFMDRVTELTDDQVKFEFYPGEQLGKAQDFIGLVRDGVADIAHFNGYSYPNEFPITSSLMSMPGLVDDGAKVSHIFHEMLKESPLLEEDFLPNGVRPILGLVTTPYELYTTGKEIRVPEDLKGLKVMSHGGVLKTAIEHLGGIPVTISASDMYESFDKGIVDVVNHYATTLNAWSMGDLIKKGTSQSHFGSVGYGLIINDKVWQGLPESVQDAINQASEEMVESQLIFDADTKEIQQEWIDKGIVQELTSDEIKKWEKANAEIRELWLKEVKHPKFREAYDLFLSKEEERQ